jgi:hypothetical protein
MCVVVAGVEGRLSSWQWAANSRAWKIDLCMLLTATLPCCRGAGGAAGGGWGDIRGGGSAGGAAAAGGRCAAANDAAGGAQAVRER